MKKLNFDIGVQEYEINGGKLRFNPSDPNVYARFVAAANKFGQIEQRMVDEAAKLDGGDAGKAGAQSLQLMETADREIKTLLGEVFGPQNDFDGIFGGVNVMAVCDNGERALTNFVAMIAPILTEGAQKCARDQAKDAAAKLRPNREQRRAAARGK